MPPNDVDTDPIDEAFLTYMEGLADTPRQAFREVVMPLITDAEERGIKATVTAITHWRDRLPMGEEGSLYNGINRMLREINDSVASADLLALSASTENNADTTQHPDDPHDPFVTQEEALAATEAVQLLRLQPLRHTTKGDTNERGTTINPRVPEQPNLGVRQPFG